MGEHEKFVKQPTSHSIHHISVTENDLKMSPAEIVRALKHGGEKIREEKKISGSISFVALCLGLRHISLGLISCVSTQRIDSLT